MELDHNACYAAVSTRDPRFDGWFFGGVLTTGIYCRPSCPARTPLRANMRFYPTAAAAQQAGFRACRRCRPDAVPGSPAYDHAADVAARAVRLVDDGYVERHGIEGLSSRLGYSSRQLNRILTGELGAGPLQLARARRAHTARILAQTTELPFGDVAFAAGFGSIRQFNDTIRDVFGCTPSELRERRGGSGRTADTHPGLRLHLAYREPFDADDLWAFLASRLIPGVEEIVGATYRRVLSLPSAPGIVELTPRAGYVEARLALTDLRDLAAAVARCRRLLDLDADPVGRTQMFADDPVLGPLARRFAGLRLPGSTDAYETAVRAVLGQQVSIAAAARLAGVLVARAGTPVTDPGGSLTHAFPGPEAVSGAIDHDPLPMPASRNRTLHALSAAVTDGRVPLDQATSVVLAADALDALPGVGPWTRDYIRLRALGDPDAFPAGDLVLRKEAGRLGLPEDTAGLAAHAAGWAPLRSWAAQLLWTRASHRSAVPHRSPAHRTAADGTTAARNPTSRNPTPRTDQIEVAS